jgi:hypothetical protein
MIMAEGAEDIALLTVRVRRDPAFPSDSFLSLRLYVIPGDGEPTLSAEFATIPEAVRLVGTWLEDFAGLSH